MTHPVTRVLFLAFALRLYWALTLPLGDGPDEQRHLRTIRFFAEHGLPTREEIFSGAYGFYIATSPLPYLPHILLEKAWHEPPLLAQRMITVALGLLLVWLGYRIMRQVRPVLALPFAWLLAVQPQLCFQAAYVNWDALTFVVSTLIVATWPDLAERRVRPWIVGGLAGLCLLGKPTGFAVLPVLLGMFIYARPSVGQWLTSAFACAAVALPFLLHNHSVLPGDPFGFHTVLGTVSADWEASVPGGWTQLWTSRWVINTFESTWGIFGHLARKLPNVMYVAFAALTLWSAVQVARRFDRPSLVALASVVSSLLLSYATSAMNDFQPYGRYLFPSLVPLFGLYLSGLGRWSYRLTIVLCLLATPLAQGAWIIVPSSPAQGEVVK